MLSSGVEPLPVALGEVVVSASAEFELPDAGGPDPELGRDGGEGDVLGPAGRPQVGVVGHLASACQGTVDLAGDGALEGAVDGFGRPALCQVRVAVGVGLS